MSKYDSLKLCLVRKNFAWFTSCPLTYQCGDGWDASPYEYNASEPYDSHETKEGLKQNHDVIRVIWESSYVTPDVLDQKSSWTVKSINKGNIPWLSSSPWSDENLRPIHSGTTLHDFIKTIRDSGGEVFVPSSCLVDQNESEVLHQSLEKKLKVKSKKKKK